MPVAGFAWECSCGYTELGEESPMECSKCFSMESFVRMPEEILREREKDALVLEVTKPIKSRSVNLKKPGRKTRK